MPPNWHSTSSACLSKQDLDRSQHFQGFAGRCRCFSFDSSWIGPCGDRSSWQWGDASLVSLNPFGLFLGRIVRLTSNCFAGARQGSLWCSDESEPKQKGSYAICLPKRLEKNRKSANRAFRRCDLNSATNAPTGVATPGGSSSGWTARLYPWNCLLAKPLKGFSSSPVKNYGMPFTFIPLT